MTNNTIREKLMETILDAVSSIKELHFTFESGSSAVSVGFVPNDVDSGENNITIYGNDIFVTFALSNILFTNEEEYVITNGTSIVTISY